MRRPRRARVEQQEFGFVRVGGKRPGAGRKPNGDRAGVSHRTRSALTGKLPVHVTMRLRAGLPSLRRSITYRAILECFSRACDRFGFRLVEYSVQSNHFHLIAEACDARALTRGAQGLAIRVARALNRLWGRKGKVFADRYHARILGSPTEVKRALLYVLRNAQRHGVRGVGLDPFSSAPAFTGWRGVVASIGLFVPTVSARSWLLRKGWRRLGLLRPTARPAGAPG